jgi:hypothetical protein
MTSDHADDDCRSSSSTATSHEEHTLYNFAMSFFSHRRFVFVLRVIRSKSCLWYNKWSIVLFKFLCSFLSILKLNKNCLEILCEFCTSDFLLWLQIPQKSPPTQNAHVSQNQNQLCEDEVGPPIAEEKKSSYK